MLFINNWIIVDNFSNNKLTIACNNYKFQITNI